MMPPPAAGLDQRAPIRMVAVPCRDDRTFPMPMSDTGIGVLIKIEKALDVRGKPFM